MWIDRALRVPVSKISHGKIGGLSLSRRLVREIADFRWFIFVEHFNFPSRKPIDSMRESV